MSPYIDEKFRNLNKVLNDILTELKKINNNLESKK